MNACLAPDQPGLTRVFGQLRDVVRLEGATLFRGVELLDLSASGSAETPHHARTAVLLDAPGAPEGMFHVSRDLTVRQIYPFDRSSERELRTYLEQVSLPPPPAPLSLTFMRGRAVAYLEPAVIGSLMDEHLRYLAGIGPRFWQPRRELS